MTASSHHPTHAAHERVGREVFDVTTGEIRSLPDGRLAIESPEVRAVWRSATPDIAEIRFWYLGPTAATKPLASGEVRRQVGLKLRARATCNVLYVMWHIEPDRRLAEGRVVSRYQAYQAGHCRRPG